LVLDNPVDKFMLTAKQFGRELEAASAWTRVKSKFLDKFLMGHWLGAAPFGYHLIEHGEGKGCFVTLAIDDETAKVVRRIFALAGDGVGYAGVAKRLAREGVPTPTGRQGTGWGKPIIRQILHCRL
jgi:hypothetical protein